MPALQVADERETRLDLRWPELPDSLRLFLRERRSEQSLPERVEFPCRIWRERAAVGELSVKNSTRAAMPATLIGMWSQRAVTAGMLAFATLGFVLFEAPSAGACGVSASGVASCSLAQHDEAVRPHWAVGASALYTSTRLRFSDDVHADQVRYAALATLAYLPTPKLVLQAGAGAAFAGSLTLADGEYRFTPGPVVLVGADFRAFDDGRYFLLLTSGLSFTAAHTHAPGVSDENYTAFDLRLGAQFGVELWRMLRPYALARVFGGPIFWHYQGEAVIGTDTHHYQLGAGLAVRVSRMLNCFVEGVPLGEQGLAAGIGLAW